MATRRGLIGFGTHTGTVAAADDWDEPMQIEQVRASLPDSHERMSHDSGVPRFLLDFRTRPGGRRHLPVGTLVLPHSGERLFARPKRRDCRRVANHLNVGPAVEQADAASYHCAS